MLGEQSMKSLRGKTGSDLIFKGSKNLSKLNRASVTIVFDNSKKVFALTTRENQAIKLDFDEISISREVYADGVNRYLINGSEVRLKDVHELLASVNIGSSGHHIISQGEADRILNASSKDRRGMVEDALGLKVYQYRLRESERKLDKTKENIKEAQSLRREIAPHITFLKKQVEKVEKAEEMRKELEDISFVYLKREETIISNEHSLLYKEKAAIVEELAALNQELKESSGVEAGPEPKERTQLHETEKMLRDLAGVKDDLMRKVGRIEGVIEFEESKKDEVEERGEEQVVHSRSEIELFVNESLSSIERALSMQTMQEISPILLRLKDHINNFRPKTFGAPVQKDTRANMSELTEKRDQILAELSALKNKEEELYAKIGELKNALRSLDEADRKRDQNRFHLMMKKNELESKENIILVKEESLKGRETAFLEDIRELSVLVGSKILGYKETTLSEQFSKEEEKRIQDETHKKIERIKIKLEDAGAIGGGEVLKEFQEVSERDQFLLREIEDLSKSMLDIESLIKDLKTRLETEFTNGIVKINKEFQRFFELMFGGGNAKLSLVDVKKRKYKLEDEDAEDADPELAEGMEDEEAEQGIDIGVSLPKKKVKELTMLSGGERSLTSIALLFAISQVNPPPFLVLDETDAALDESNSRKYGDMIETLANYSQLLVVTHNRETMSRANVLYGVTLGADDASRLLSVKFDDAVAIAK